MIRGTFFFIGDSFIAGYDWQARMSGFTVHSYGVPDEKAQDLLLRLPAIVDAVESPDIILIMSGISNVLAEDYAFIDVLRKIIIRLSKTYPGAEIIVNSLPHIQVPLLVKDAIRHLNANIRTLAQESGCCFLDNFTKYPTFRHDLFLKDGIHLTDESYALWSRSFLEYVAFLLEDEN
jgi:lysophospholipase L1-like esterase